MAQVIRNHGQPNPLFPKDRDLTYGKHLPPPLYASQFCSLGTLLIKNNVTLNMIGMVP